MAGYQLRTDVERTTARSLSTRNRQRSISAVVWVHGGGWQSGAKELSANAFQRRLTARGFALASIGYRLSGEAIFPAQIHDVKAAFRYLRAPESDFHLDASRIGVWGGSAGAHLVSLLGSSAGVLALEGTIGNAQQSSRVHVVVDWYGPMDFMTLDTELNAVGCPFSNRLAANSPESKLIGAAVAARPDLAHAANPITYLTADEPPFMIQHAADDCTVPYQQRETFRAAIGLAGGTVSLEIIPNAGHGGPAFSTTENVEKVIRFFEQHLTNR